jgi:hypothetical protein
MADKRATPQDTRKAAHKGAHKDAPKGPGRKPRAAPTIDLTAKEVVSAPADPPPPPQETQEAPQAEPLPEPPPQEPAPPADTASSDTAAAAPPPSRTPHMIWPALVAGFASAGVVVLILLALWLTGLVPVGDADTNALRPRVAGLETQLHDLQNNSAPAVESKTLDALAQRLGKIEKTVAALPPVDASVAERLTAAEAAMKSHDVGLTALNRRTDDSVADAAQARARADAAAKAVAELQASMKDAAANASASVPRADLDALDKRMTALEDETKAARADIAKIGTQASVSENATRLALSAAVLRDVVLVGAPYADELAAVKQFGGDDQALAALAPFAASGVPDKTSLAHELTALLPALRKLTDTQPPSGNFLDRLAANAGKLVRVRPLNAPPGDDPAAVLARLEIDVAKPDITAALADIGQLPDAERQLTADWVTKAVARQKTLAAARQFAATAARGLGQP